MASLLSLDVGYLFGEFQCLPVDDCPAASCDYSALVRGSERTSFYSAILNQSLPVTPILKASRHSSIKKCALATVLMYLGQAGRYSLICNPWHRQPHEIRRTNRYIDIKAMSLFFFVG